MNYRAYTEQIYKSNEDLKLNGTGVVLVWIPSHIGITGNETADYHAKLARSLPVNSITNKICTIKQCKKKAHDWMLEAWQDYNDKQMKALHYKRIEPNVTI